MRRSELAYLARLIGCLLIGGILTAAERLRTLAGGELVDEDDVATVAEWGHMGIPEGGP